MDGQRKPRLSRRKVPCPICHRLTRVYGDGFPQMDSYLELHERPDGQAMCTGSGATVAKPAPAEEVANG